MVEYNELRAFVDITKGFFFWLFRGLRKGYSILSIINSVFYS